MMMKEYTQEETKVLVCCERGASRSQALAWLLKDFYGVDALACGVSANSKATLEKLYDWADMVITTSEFVDSQIPEEWRGKVVLWNVGEDRYFMGFHPGLIDQYLKYIEKDTTWKGDERVSGLVKSLGGL